MSKHYYNPQGGLASQDSVNPETALFTNSFAFIPRAVLSDITTSALPFWNHTRLWVLARPMTGFAETFSHYIMEISAGGGSEQPEDDQQVQSVLFITSGALTLSFHGQDFTLEAGAYAYLPAQLSWQIHNQTAEKAVFHWIRKRYQSLTGIVPPRPFVTSDHLVEAEPMPNTDGKWTTSRFVAPDDVRHDMHVNIVTLAPGAQIPFSETHVMEHGLYILQGSGKYQLNQSWFDVEAGDYLWLRAFCPQSCIATGDEPFRYLLYKDVNRHARMHL